MVFKKNNPGCTNSSDCECGCCALLQSLVNAIDGTDDFYASSSGGHCGYSGTWGVVSGSGSATYGTSANLCFVQLGGYVGTTGDFTTARSCTLYASLSGAGIPAGVTGTIWLEFFFRKSPVLSTTFIYERSTCDDGSFTFVSNSNSSCCATSASSVSLTINV